MRQIKYEDCTNFVRNVLKIRLFDYQEDILKAMCEGREIRCARGIGRTFVARCLGKHVAHLHDRNDYTKDPELRFPYTVAIRSGQLRDVDLYRIRTCFSKIFEREYECK